MAEDPALGRVERILIYIVCDTHSGNIKFEATEQDTLICLGDWVQGEIDTKAKKILVRGDGDTMATDAWDFVCDGLLLDHIWFTHEPAFSLPLRAKRNIFGHLHAGNINDFGYQEKEWHFWLPPNEVHELDRFIFESTNRKNLELKRSMI